MKHLRGQFDSSGIFSTKRFVVWLIDVFRFVADNMRLALYAVSGSECSCT